MQYAENDAQQFSPMTDLLAQSGRGGDSVMAHLTPGDVVIPRDVVMNNPEFLTKLKKAMEMDGGDYRTHIVGSGFESFNPETGAPELFFSGIGRALRKIIKNPVSTLTGAATGLFTGGPVGAVVGGLGGVYNTVKSNPTGQTNPVRAQEAMMKSSQPAQFSATRPDQASRPASLSRFGSMDPMQERSALATEGSMGGGLGQEERDYYLNILQRNLIDERNNVGDINSALLPVERQYLTNQGLPSGDARKFLEAIQRPA
jgi:hypothetical protein